MGSGVAKVACQQAGLIVRSASGKLSGVHASRMSPPAGEVDEAGRGHEHGPHAEDVQLSVRSSDDAAGALDQDKHEAKK
jgi:hypothetical protein